MGSVSDVSCEPWREALAVMLLGDPLVDEMTGLLAHLEGCVACQTLAAELTETVAMLQHVDDSFVEAKSEMPPDLTARVLGDLRAAGMATLRRRRTRTVIASLAGALAAALILVTVVTGSSSSSSSPEKERTLALHGNASVTATALLVKQPWGTALQLRERGLPGGEVYTVSMETKSGRWWTAGTYRSVDGRTVSATMTCAVSLGKITGVRVVNNVGVTVLDSDTNGPGASYH